MLIKRLGRIARRVVGACASNLAVIAAGLIATAFAPSTAEAKTPGKTYCFHGVCHRVNTIAEMVALVGRDSVMKTSFYDDCKRDRYNPCGLTSSGEKFRPLDPDNAASPIYPNGTVLMLRNPVNGLTAVVRVNNAGPYWGKRTLDVSRGVAESLGFKPRGVADLEVRVVSAPTIAEARYKKNRRYVAVPGPIGQYASLDRAQGGMMVAMALNAMSGSLFAPAASKMLPGLRTAKPALANVLRAGTAVASLETPLEGLKAAARRAYGTDRLFQERRMAPSSLMADIVPAVGARSLGRSVADRRDPMIY
ncbi:MAG: RlpA-like double-psi beta-barrel domain-containing protein [Hyphomicrobium sp.]